MNKRKYTLLDFIVDANKFHRNKYDYSLVEYKNSLTKVKIICPEHGVFEQLPSNHIHRKRGCSKCNGGIKYDKEKNIELSKIIHGDKYDYSLVEYKNSLTNVKIICPEHGVFNMCFNTHINQKQGCSYCVGKIKTTENFISAANKIHHNKYDYSLVEYKNSKTRIKIICPEHGIFEQVASIHISKRKCGCPICKASKGEIGIKNWLDSRNIKYIQQYRFSDCKYKKLLRFDFYLPELNICIEYDGEQHYKPIKNWGGNKSLDLITLKDDIKNKYCLNNGVKLIRIKYDEVFETILQSNIYINF